MPWSCLKKNVFLVEERPRGARSGKEYEFSLPKEDPLGVLLGVRAIEVRHPKIDWDEFVNESLSDLVEHDIDFMNMKVFYLYFYIY